MGIKNDDLGIRMKKYEYVTRTHLTPRTPVIIRIDGKAFHTFTRGFRKPFDEVLMMTMESTMLYLCKNIQGCVLGYTQSDEISLVLVDYKKLTSNGWFDYNIQKCASIAASMATLGFNRAFPHIVNCNSVDSKEWRGTVGIAYERAIDSGALFDARCFNLPKEEVCNYFLWRQNDAIRNSVSMLAQANFSHKELQGKSSREMKEMLVNQKGISWDDLYPHDKKHGSCCIKIEDTVGGIQRCRWEIDEDIPIFKGEGRNYIDSKIFIGE